MNKKLFNTESLYRTPREGVEFVVSYGSPSIVEFTSPRSSGDPKVDRARAYLFESRNPKGAVLFVHGTGQKNFNPLKYYPDYFADHGYTTIMPVLPYHFERTPDGKKSGLSFLQGNDVQIAERFDQAVTDLLTCVDFLQKKGFNEVNIMGFSFGGMVSTIAMALDQRIKKGSFVVTGGNYEYITWKSVATKIMRVRYEESEECDQQKCEIKHAIFDKAANRFNSLKDIKDLPVCFTYDPSIFAKMVRSRKKIFFTARFDPFIPRASSDDLWKRMGRPKRYLLFSGHLSAHLLYRRFIARKSLEPFNSR